MIGCFMRGDLTDQSFPSSEGDGSSNESERHETTNESQENKSSQGSSENVHPTSSSDKSHKEGECNVNKGHASNSKVLQNSQERENVRRSGRARKSNPKFLDQSEENKLGQRSQEDKVIPAALIKKEPIDPVMRIREDLKVLRRMERYVDRLQNHVLQIAGNSGLEACQIQLDVLKMCTAES